MVVCALTHPVYLCFMWKSRCRLENCFSMQLAQDISHMCLLTITSGNCSLPPLPSRVPLFPVKTNSAKPLMYSTMISKPLIPSSLPRSSSPSSPSSCQTFKNSAIRGMSVNVKCAAPLNTSSSLQPERRSHSSFHRMYGSELDRSEEN